MSEEKNAIEVPEKENAPVAMSSSDASIKDVREGSVKWIPKTKLGKDVLSGKYKSIEEIIENGETIIESEIVDYLIPDLAYDIVFIGGSPGKGGGIRRTPTKMTARMHKSGRRFKISAMIAAGNSNGIIGIGSSTSKENRVALEKALNHAKLSLISVRRGCGSWECGCGMGHSVPFKVSGKSGSVTVTIMPAPKGVGLVGSAETKKILKLAGIKDAWIKTDGQTATRDNLAKAIIEALKNLKKGKGEMQ